MQLALYRKYRSKRLEDIVGQQHVTGTLGNAIKHKNIKHAYLFTGPHGIGKTSVARILAHEITGLDYDDTSHIDIIEIDAASNRRIDEVRDLREKARIAPAVAAFKVYIIDEVHMLTSEAFNALLKTLEEPPEHVVFILATTEAHKLPDTIISRTQRFQFKPVPKGELVKHLAHVAEKESINVDAGALETIANHSSGSVRDALSLLDQLAATAGQSTITIETVETLLGLTDQQTINELLTAVFGGNAIEALNVITKLYDTGVSAATLAHQLIDHLQTEASTKPTTTNIQLTADLLEVAGSSFPQEKLQVILLQAALNNGSNNELATPPAQSTPPKKVDAPKKKPQSKPSQPTETPSKPTKSQTKAPKSDAWQHVIDHIKAERSSLHAILRLAQPRLEQDTLKLAFRFPFHQKRANQSDNRSFIEQTVEKFYGQRLKLQTVVDETIKSELPDIDDDVPATQVAESTNKVVDIMGGGEVIAYEDG